MISRLRAVSRFPVGSSARRTAGFVTMARAMATRCCCPPESSPGEWVSHPVSPTVSRASRARARRSEAEAPR